MTVDEEPIIDAEYFRRKAELCLEMARTAVVPEIINGLAQLAAEFEMKARAFEQETDKSAAEP